MVNSDEEAEGPYKNAESETVLVTKLISKINVMRRHIYYGDDERCGEWRSSHPFVRGESHTLLIKACMCGERRMLVSVRSDRIAVAAVCVPACKTI